MASIKCGHCRKIHESAAAVFRCSMNQANETARAAAPATETATGHRLGVRENKFAQDCAKCGHEVAALAGRLERNASGRWDVYHMDGQCGEIVRNPKQGGKFPEGFKAIPAGHYAVKSLTGNNDLDFFRVDRPTEGRHAGRIFVKRVIGGKPEAPVHGSTRYAALEAIVKAGVDAAGFLYGQELGRCRKCNRHLTDETSRSLSMGPECRSK